MVEFEGRMCIKGAVGSTQAVILFTRESHDDWRSSRFYYFVDAKGVIIFGRIKESDDSHSVSCSINNFER